MDSSSSSSSSSSPLSSTSQGLTVTQREQLEVEARVAEIYQVLHGVPQSTRALMMELWRDRHVEYFTRGLDILSPGFKVLDASRPWICYWLLHSLALLGESIDEKLGDNIVDFLSRCQGRCGGYGGGPGQLPHLATTYAAVNALVTLGTEKALSSINRGKMHAFLLRMKDTSGGFRMHDGGEIDVRASYTAISVASILKILDKELASNVGNYILSCQTYEGGIGGEPGSEAHGGYTFCGLASMILINEYNKLDLLGLIDWVAFRQGAEYGFQGRTNKLVDGCYSFWQGATLALVQRIMPSLDKQLNMSHGSSFREGKEEIDNIVSSDFSEGLSFLDEDELSQFGHLFLSKQSESAPLFQPNALQQYILLCSQVLEGGFKDKPGKSRDHYHSCYCLSGLSICQYSWLKDVDGVPLQNAVLGTYSNLLEPIHPLYNIVRDKYRQAHAFFSSA